MPVSDEKDMSRPLAAMLSTVTSAYPDASNSRNPLPGMPGSDRERQDQRQYAAAPELAVGQGGERRGDAGVAVVAGALRQGIDPAAHSRLRGGVGIERGEHRVDDLGVPSFMVGGAGERRVHDYQVEPFVGYLRGDLGGRLFADAAGAKGRVGGVDEDQLAGRFQQFQRADLDVGFTS